MISSILLGVFALTALIVAGIYFLGIQPARIVEKWSAGLSNGGHFPEKPDVQGLYWLLPVHRELQRVADKISGLKKQVLESKDQKAQDEFLYHCVLASLMEGVLVVDRHGIITLVNAEFINIFQLTQSPLQRTMLEVIRDKKLQALITDALTSGRVQSARITRPNATEVGRPPVMEVSAVPIRTQKEMVNGVIVLFLPPPDRTRILQLMKRHSQRLDNLVNELQLTGAGPGKPLPLKKESIDLRELLEESISVFASKAENSEIKVAWQTTPDTKSLAADASYLQVALVHLLDNLAADLDKVTEIHLMTESGLEDLSIRITFDSASIAQEDLQHAFDAAFISGRNERQIIGSGSGLNLVREIIHLHGGQLTATVLASGHTEIRLKIPYQTAPAYQ